MAYSKGMRGSVVNALLMETQGKGWEMSNARNVPALAEGRG